MIRLKRAYEPPARSDGYRVLVDRLWPRGLRKVDAHLDAWLKDVAPSDALRKWFHHDPSRFGQFRERYARELGLEDAQARLDELARKAQHENVTLVYAAHDEHHNNAVVLAEELERRRARLRRSTKSTGRSADRRSPPRRRAPAAQHARAS